MKIDAAIAANRFGLGARPGDLDRIDQGPQAWLLDQLQGPSRLPAELRNLPDSADVLVEVQDLRKEEREMRNAPEDDPGPDIVKMYRGTVRGHYREQTDARYRLAAASDYPFHERLVHFWTNHFAVSADKQPLPALVDKLAATYLASGGALTAVYAALVTAADAWAAPFGKYKTPHDFVISTLPAFKHVPDNGRLIVGALDQMGQTPFRPGSPAGWPDTAEQWGGALW